MSGKKIPLLEKRAIISILLFVGNIYTQDFGYDGTNGPTHWGEQYNSCVGKHQSPININLLSVKNVILTQMEFFGFDDPMDNVTITNNGHTVLIQVYNDPQPAVVGGPLYDKYIFSQMHFHWGDNDTIGSEDRINSRSFPMELHMVFYKEIYGDAVKALDHDDGLTVLAFFYEVDRYRHPAYDEVTAALGNVTEPSTSVSLMHPFSLLTLLPYDLSRYFTYSGSLTTPPCSEVVTWIDFEQPIRLARDQIDSFRRLKSFNGPITHNFRPVQPIGDRQVFYNSDRLNYYQNDNEITEPQTTAPEKSQDRRHRNLGNRLSADISVVLAFILTILLNVNVEWNTIISRRENV